MSDLKPFPFTGPDSKTYQLPDMRALSTRELQAADRGDIEALEAALLRRGAEQADVDALFDLPLHEMGDVITAWISGDGEGKLSKPSPSSKSTAPRSRRTSSSAASRNRKR